MFTKVGRKNSSHLLFFNIALYLYPKGRNTECPTFVNISTLAANNRDTPHELLILFIVKYLKKMKTTILILLFSFLLLTNFNTANCQTNPKNNPPAWVGAYIGSTKEGVSVGLLTEYSNIISKYQTDDKEWWKNIETNIAITNRQRLEKIFKNMSVEQQSKQKVVFLKGIQPLKKVVPTNEQFTSWKNGNIYGVWIDGRKVENKSLDNYSIVDFEQVFVSKLYGAAKKGKKYSYQVDLMTKEYYQKYYRETVAKSGNRMVFRA